MELAKKITLGRTGLEVSRLGVSSSYGAKAETFEEALSYFIGTEGSEDKGFAIKGWTNVRWESNGILRETS